MDNALTPTLSQKERERKSSISQVERRYRSSISQVERRYRSSISQVERRYRSSFSQKEIGIDTQILMSYFLLRFIVIEACSAELQEPAPLNCRSLLRWTAGACSAELQEPAPLNSGVDARSGWDLIGSLQLEPAPLNSNWSLLRWIAIGARSAEMRSWRQEWVRFDWEFAIE